MTWIGQIFTDQIRVFRQISANLRSIHFCNVPIDNVREPMPALTITGLVYNLG